MGVFTTNNDTFACSNSGCQISCQSPEFGSRVCYSMQQNFLDGTSCQGGGKCNNGLCQGASFGNEVKSWIQDNKTLVIGLSCGLGGILLFSLACCCVSRCRRRNRLRNRASMPPPIPPSGWNNGHRVQSYQRNSQLAYGAGGQSYMSEVPPAYSNSQSGPARGGWGNDGRWDPNLQVPQPPPVWQPSVRYA